jgi:hypothetical protein
MANYIENITTPGQGLVSSLNGQIQIDEAQAKMRIYDPQLATDLVVIDRTGFLFSDGTDRRIKLGSFAARVGLWISKPGVDVINELE